MPKKTKIIIGIVILLGAIVLAGIGLANYKTVTNVGSSEEVFDRIDAKLSNSNTSAYPLGSPLSNARGSATKGASGTLPAGTYYFKLTSTDLSGGQTLPTDEFTCTPTVTATGSCTVAISLNSRASTTRLWVATSTGIYYGYLSATSSTLVSTTTGLTAGTIPTTNTAFNDIGIARYNANGVTLTDRDLSNLQSDVSGRLITTEANNSFAYALADTVVKATAGFVHTITFSPSDAAATAGSIAICNNATSCGTGTSTIFYVPAAAMVPVTITLDQYFSSGIYVDFTTTADVNVNVSYK